MRRTLKTLTWMTVAAVALAVGCSPTGDATIGQNQLAMGMAEAQHGAEAVESALDISDRLAMHEGITRMEWGVMMMRSTMMGDGTMGDNSMMGDGTMGDDGMMCDGMMSDDNDGMIEMMRDGMMMMSEAMEHLTAADRGWDADMHGAHDMASEGLDMFREGMARMEGSMADDPSGSCH